MKYSNFPALLTLSLSSKSVATVSLKEHLQNQDTTKVYDFDFHGGVFLSSSEVNGDFCDPDSEVSLSGYFGCKCITSPILFVHVYLLEIIIYLRIS